MSLQEIIERFSLVSGFEMQETSRYLTLIRDCAEQFEAKLEREPGDTERRRLAYACAVYAYYRICCMACDGGFRSFKAGDVQVVSDEDRAGARRMWETERELIADIIRFDDSFAFRSVSV